MVFSLALAASWCYALAWVLQYREASDDGAKASLSLGLFGRLIRRPIWLAGMGAMVLGNILQAVALDLGRLSIVEPVLVSSLLFALILGAVLTRQRLKLLEWTAAIALTAGLGLFLLVVVPHGGRPDAALSSWLAAVAAVVIATALVWWWGRKRGPHARAALFATGAGILFGLQDALTKTSLWFVSRDGVGVLAQWQPYAVVLVAIYGLLLSQDAYKSGPLPAALPPLATLEPVVGVALGVVLFGEQFHTSTLDVVVAVGATMAMVAGAVILARSPLVVGRDRAHPEYTTPQRSRARSDGRL